MKTPLFVRSLLLGIVFFPLAQPLHPDLFEDRPRITLNGKKKVVRPKKIKAPKPAKPKAAKAVPAPASQATPVPPPEAKPKPKPVPMEESRRAAASYGTPETKYFIPRLSVGVVYTGAQVRTRIGRRFGLEARYLTDAASSNLGSVTANVVSGRAYLFSKPTRGFTFYTGGEGGTLDVDTPDEAGLSFKGLVLGGFVGLEYQLGRRFSWGMDAGYYQITLDEIASSISDSGADFVINSYLNIHLF